MTDQKDNLASLEAGDEFEDFPTEKWSTSETTDDKQLWEEDWEDDDGNNDDFERELKSKLDAAK